MAITHADAQIPCRAAGDEMTVHEIANHTRDAKARASRVDADYWRSISAASALAPLRPIRGFLTGYGSVLDLEGGSWIRAIKTVRRTRVSLDSAWGIVGQDLRRAMSQVAAEIDDGRRTTRSGR